MNTVFTNLMPHDSSLERASNAIPANHASEVAALKAQRDELLDALKSAAASLEQLVSIKHIPANNAGLRDASAALAKHKEAGHG